VLTDTVATSGGRHPDSFQLSPPAAPPGQAGNEGQLHRRDDPAVPLTHHEELVRICIDGRERRVVRLAVVRRLAGRANLVVREQGDHGWDVFEPGPAEGEVHTPMRSRSAQAVWWLDGHGDGGHLQPVRAVVLPRPWPVPAPGRR